MMNLEGEGLSDAHQFFRQKLLRRGVVKPNEEEQQQLAQELANKQPDPQSAFLLASAEESKAKATKAQADAIKAAAQAKQAEAETAATLVGVSRDDPRASGGHHQGRTRDAERLASPAQPPAV